MKYLLLFCLLLVGCQAKTNTVWCYPQDDKLLGQTYADGLQAGMRLSDKDWQYKLNNLQDKVEFLEAEVKSLREDHRHLQVLFKWHSTHLGPKAESPIMRGDKE